MTRQLLVLLVILPGFALAQIDTTGTDAMSHGRGRFLPFTSDNGQLHLRNEQGTFARKMLRGGLFVHAFEGLGYATLAALPTEISGWRYSSFSNYGSNMERAFTSPPVFDSDKWYLNYVGHPYQGSLFYNAVRSQNARIWQSSLFCLGQVLVWEYVLESGLEQPSIQDLIVTPLAGIVIGELVHRGTMAMARNGFRWYEATAVIIINPMFMLNNGLKFARESHRSDRLSD